MAVPQRRTSVARKRKRRTHFKLALPGMAVCPKCEKTVEPHRVCKHCGHYDGKKVA